MIEVLYADGRIERPTALSFEQIGEIVGGFVECNHVQLNGTMVQALCNEDGLSLGLPSNEQAKRIFGGKLLMDPMRGAVGNWVVLSGKDMLK